MKNQILCAALAALLAISTTKIALAQQYQWQWFGIGNESCARWTTSRVAALELEASTWIMGFWSGLNRATVRVVGSTTDGDGIIEEVRKLCKEQPALKISSATYEVYSRFQSSEK